MVCHAARVGNSSVKLSDRYDNRKEEIQEKCGEGAGAGNQL